MGKLQELDELRSATLTPEQVAEMLCLSVHTLEKWRSMRPQNPPFLKIGRNVRYRAQDIAAFFELKRPRPNRRRRTHS
jgi:hypothetical protein